MNQETRYELMSKRAAYQIKKALDIFKDEPEHVKAMAGRVIMERVTRMSTGESFIVEGPYVTKVDETD